MTARKNSYLALRRRMQRIAALLEQRAGKDYSHLTPVAAEKIEYLQTGYRAAAQQIRENL